MKNSAIENLNIKGYMLRRAQLLALITIFYNLVEGVVSLLFGWDDETLSLFGFGLDSFVEVMSGVGILHMVLRLKHQPEGDRDRFEQVALRVTGSSFYLLAVGLAVSAALNLYRQHHPQTTIWGVVVSIVSIFTMWLLIHFKTQVGKQLHSDAILADAECTKTCLYLSFVLLVASVGYELTGIGILDSLGAIAIGIFAFREGREAFEKARGKMCCCRDQ